MKKKFTHYRILILSGLLSIIFLGSCVSAKKLTYFSNIQRDSIADIPINNFETLVTRNDILSINISTPDQSTNGLLNSRIAVNEASGQGGVSGYLVDADGYIKLPLLGNVKAVGLTKTQLATEIKQQLLDKKLAKDPIVNIRLVNFKVTVLGEVTRPGVFPAPNERMTLPEALGLAGDLTPYGKRGNVLLIRETEGKRIWKRFSLNKQQMFDKDIFNLQNQDIIYVEPNDAKAAAGDRLTQLLPIIFSTVSLLIVVYSQFIR